jgi:AcrR family transcriptional regulator
MCKYSFLHVDVQIWSVQSRQEPSTMTLSPPRPPQRSHARSNHARILAAAREELSRDPDASLDQIARAAGIARRTLYGHFPNRDALITALATEATQSLEEAFTAARRQGDVPPVALARLILASWPVGDRYRMLISLARRRLGEEHVRAALAPARAEATAILERGQRDGTFADHLPAPVLALATESVVLAVLESHASPRWNDPTGEAAATAVLIAAGIDPTSARRHVHAILSEETRRATI